MDKLRLSHKFYRTGQRHLYQGDKRFIPGGQEIYIRETRDLYQGDMGDKRFISGGHEIYIRGTRDFYQGDKRFISGGHEIYIRGT